MPHDQSLQQTDDDASPALNSESEELLQVITEFVNAADWEKSRAVLKAHPELLKPKAESAFALLIDLSEAQREPEAAHILRMHRDLLLKCREKGIDRAFKELADSTPPTPAIDEPDILEIIVSNTIAVMTIIPQQRALWSDTLEQTRIVAGRTGNEAVHDLLAAVIRLLDGERPSLITPSLVVPYQIYWQQIVDGFLAGNTEQALGSNVTMFDMLSNETVNMLVGNDRYGEWPTFVANLLAQSRDLGDDHLCHLLEAIHSLVTGTLADDLSPELEGEHQTCWVRIVENLERKTQKP